MVENSKFGNTHFSLERVILVCFYRPIVNLKKLHPGVLYAQNGILEMHSLLYIADL